MTRKQIINIIQSRNNKYIKVKKNKGCDNIYTDWITFLPENLKLLKSISEKELPNIEIDSIKNKYRIKRKL